LEWHANLSVTTTFFFNSQLDLWKKIIKTKSDMNSVKKKCNAKERTEGVDKGKEPTTMN
jgi:hypothetical protein